MDRWVNFMTSTIQNYSNTVYLEAKQKQQELSAKALQAFLLISNSVVTLQSLQNGQPLAASAPTGAPSKVSSTSAIDPVANDNGLNETWSDVETAGLISFLDRMINEGGPASAIEWAKNKLQSLVDSGKLSSDFADMAKKVLGFVSDPSHPDKSGFDSYWVVEKDGKDGPIAKVFEALQDFMKDPKDMLMPHDDGTAQFLMTSIFADFSSKNSSALSEGVEKMFEGTPYGPDAAADYAVQMAYYLTTITGDDGKPLFSNDDLKKIVGAIENKDAQGSSEQEFFERLDEEIKKFTDNGGWPSNYHKENIYQDAATDWNNWVLNS